MARDPRAYLWDVQEAGQDIQSFVLGMDAATFADNALVQAAVERKFEVIGEALNQLTKVDPALAAQVPDVVHIVAFRNQLIHGYARVRPQTVWHIADTALPGLMAVVQALLREQDQEQAGES